MMVAEETMPAEADSGIRRFAVEAPDGARVVVSVMEERLTRPLAGDIHEWRPRLCATNQVVTNQQITTALIQIVNRTLADPPGQALRVPQQMREEQAALTGEGEQA